MPKNEKGHHIDGMIGAPKFAASSVTQAAGAGMVDIDGDGVFDMQYGMKIDVAAGASVNPGGADGSKSMETPRPDGPQPTEQQINEGPYTGRHVGGWKMKRQLLAPEDARDHGRHISMSNVHGTFFAEPKGRWFETHNAAHDVPPAQGIKERLYPLDREQFSPWMPSSDDMKPMSKAVGAYYDVKSGATVGEPSRAAVHPAKMGHIQGHNMPPSKGVKAKKEIQPLKKAAMAHDNPSWAKQREGDESQIKADPSWGYTGHAFANRYDAGEEDLSMATRISRRRQQAIERRFSQSPYAHEIAKTVIALGDGVDPPDTWDPKKSGWASFPPTGLGAS